MDGAAADWLPCGDTYRFEDLIFTANANNVILTELSEKSSIFRGYHNFDDEDYWYFLKDLTDDVEECFYGPDCALCGRLAYPDEEIIKYNDKPFTFIFIKTAEQKSEGELEGFLRCVYCFRYFHRYNCVLELSDKSYYKAKMSKTWSCPGCVPSFSPQENVYKNVTRNKIIVNFNFKTLILLFKALYHLSNFLLFDNLFNVFIELILCLYGTFVFLMFSFDVG